MTRSLRIRQANSLAALRKLIYAAGDEPLSPDLDNTIRQALALAETYGLQWELLCAIYLRYPTKTELDNFHSLRALGNFAQLSPALKAAIGDGTTGDGTTGGGTTGAGTIGEPVQDAPVEVIYTNRTIFDLSALLDGVFPDPDRPRELKTIWSEVTQQWDPEPSPQLARWDNELSAYRPLTFVEYSGLVNSVGLASSADEVLTNLADQTTKNQILVPINTSVIGFGEFNAESAERLAVMAQWSSNQLNLVGNGLGDLLDPNTSAERLLEVSRQLIPLKNVSAIVALTQNAKQQYEGFFSALVSQGITPPQITQYAIGAFDKAALFVNTANSGSHPNLDGELAAVIEPTVSIKIAAWQRRLAQVANVLDSPDEVTADTIAELAATAHRLSSIGGKDTLWLVFAVFTGSIPSPDIMDAALKSYDEGPMSLFALLADNTSEERLGWTATILSDRKIIDISETIQSTLATGIQRVVRDSSKYWFLHPEAKFVAWTKDFLALRPISYQEESLVIRGKAGLGNDVKAIHEFIVPWRAVYILPEVTVRIPSAERLETIAEYSKSNCYAYGHDISPITSSETNYGAMPWFAAYLRALKKYTAIATNSLGTATEFNGWKRMWGADETDHPVIVPVPLPAVKYEPREDALAKIATRFQSANVPFVLIVGSHEPRKNHNAVLRAAARLWDEGLLFKLVFAGSATWHAEDFHYLVDQLKAAGRDIELAQGLSDEELWAAYSLARFSVFPSLNEGYGLPVAESLSAGTPVITANYGSMKEIADAGGGALLINPRDTNQIYQAMKDLLVDDQLLNDLKSQAAKRKHGTWAEFAEQLWEVCG